jgi:hypothetical protein
LCRGHKDPIGCAIHARQSTGGLRASTICVVSLWRLSSACALLPKNGPITWNLFTYLFSSVKLWIHKFSSELQHFVQQLYLLYVM